ncbi:unnamed protein product [Ectocarpus sp. 4 AP-2014]
MSSNQDNNHEINGPSSGHSSSLILRKNCDRCTVKKLSLCTNRFHVLHHRDRSQGVIYHVYFLFTPPADVWAAIDHTGRGSVTHPRPTCEGGHGGRILVLLSNNVGAEIGHEERRSKTYTRPTCEGGHRGRIVVLLSIDVGAEIDHAGRGSNQHPQRTCEGGNGGRIIVLLSNGTQ